jgi:hypothetical protein
LYRSPVVLIGNPGTFRPSFFCGQFPSRLKDRRGIILGQNPKVSIKPVKSVADISHIIFLPICGLSSSSHLLWFKYVKGAGSNPVNQGSEAFKRVTEAIIWSAKGSSAIRLHFASQAALATLRFEMGQIDQKSPKRVACDDMSLFSFFICIFLGLWFGSDSVSDSVFFGLPPRLPRDRLVST